MYHFSCLRNALLSLILVTSLGAFVAFDGLAGEPTKADKKAKKKKMSK